MLTAHKNVVVRLVIRYNFISFNIFVCGTSVRFFFRKRMINVLILMNAWNKAQTMRVQKVKICAKTLLVHTSVYVKIPLGSRWRVAIVKRERS